MTKLPESDSIPQYYENTWQTQALDHQFQPPELPKPIIPNLHTEVVAGNELSFNDTYENEQFYIHAQKDLTEVVHGEYHTNIQEGDYNTLVQEEDFKLKAKSISIRADKGINFKVNDSNYVKMEPDVIYLKGSKIHLNGPSGSGGPASNTEGKNWIGFKYLDEYGKPMEDMPFTATLDDGTQRKGKLDGRGSVKITGHMAEVGSIILGDKPKLEAKLDQQREKLKISLGKVLAKVKAVEAKKQAEYDKEGYWHQRLDRTEAIGEGLGYGLFVFGKGIVDCVAAIGEGAASLGQALAAAMQGNTKALRALKSKTIKVGKQTLNSLELACKVLSDTKSDKILSTFCKAYWNAESSPDKIKLGSFGTVMILLTIAGVVTGNEEVLTIDVTAGGSEVAEAGTEIEDIATTLAKLDKCLEVTDKGVDNEHLITMNNRDLDFTVLPKPEIKKAIKILKDAGYSKAKRKEMLTSFQLDKLVVRQASSDECGIRYYDNITAFPKGRYLFDRFPVSRENLAIKAERNQMKHLKQWKINEGSHITEGHTADQGPGLPGGQLQKFILDSEKYITEP